jgi:GNAT superfamily N-acetyltransferase
MNIVRLKERTEYMTTLAEWHYKEWAYLHDVDSVERRVGEFNEEFQANGIPVTFVALSGNILLGSSSLILHDMDTRIDLTPWLASVIVAPEHRRKGVGTALVKHAMNEAGRLGVKTLYLYTPDRISFYERLGWIPLERVPYHGTEVDIMRFESRSNV